MRLEEATFGRTITDRRKQLGFSQKQLAELVQREEGGSISPQYLNDIEHDRRSPSSDHLVNEFARVLNMSANYLSYLAGRVPAAARLPGVTAADVDKWVASFRRDTKIK